MARRSITGRSRGSSSVGSGNRRQGIQELITQRRERAAGVETRGARPVALELGDRLAALRQRAEAFMSGGQTLDFNLGWSAPRRRPSEEQISQNLALKPGGQLYLDLLQLNRDIARENQRKTESGYTFRANLLTETSDLIRALTGGQPPLGIGVGDLSLQRSTSAKKQRKRDAGVRQQNQANVNSLAARRNRQIAPGQATGLRQRANTLLVPSESRRGRLT